MQLVDGWYIPNGDLPLHHNAESVINHDKKLKDKVLELTSKRKLMVDVGGNVGRWAWEYSSDFNNVIAFEPASYNIECFKKNLIHRSNVALHEFGLSNSECKGELEVVVPEHLGSTRVIKNDSGPIVLKTLDSLKIPCMDVLKIDVEGNELDVMEGGKQTIDRCSPLIVVERCVFNTGSEGKRATHNWLTDMGYTRLYKITRDCIYGRI